MVSIRTSWLVPLACSAIALCQSPVQVELVRGLPFTATVITESSATLVDGNHITRKTPGNIARDSLGRTRRESAMGNAGPLVITDAAGATAYILDQQTKTLRKFAVESAERIQPAGEEPLGTQTVEGFIVEGTRLRRSISPEQAGSDHPIEVISETWYSPELHTVLLHKLTDPRIGEVAYKLTGIQRLEPDPSLFEIPKESGLDGVPPERPSKVHGAN